MGRAWLGGGKTERWAREPLNTCEELLRITLSITQNLAVVSSLKEYRSSDGFGGPGKYKINLDICNKVF